MATPFETFVNGELPKRVSTEDSPISWTPGRVVVTTGVGLGVTTDEFPAPPVLSVNSDVGDVVITAASISAIPTSQKGDANGVASLDANGFVPLSQMNPGVVERLYVVTDETARFALTTAQVQNGDVVKQELPEPVMYYVHDDTNLDSELGYAIFAVGTAAAVAWSGVTGVPQILLDLENIAGASNGDILQFIDGTWVKQSRNAYVSALNLQTSEIEGLDTALGDKQDHDLTLDALSDLPDTGFIVQIAPDSFASRSLEAGDGISITFPDGVDGDPLIAFQEGPVEASGTHGDENTYLGLDIDSHGRTTLVTAYQLQEDTVYIPNSTDPFPLTTKTLYMIGDYFTTTYGDLYLQLPPLTASTIIEIQLAFTIEQVGHVYITPSGTDLIFGGGTPVDLKTLPLAPGCTIKLFFHSVGLGWIVQANYSDHLIDPKIHPFNAASFGIGHHINSNATSGLSIQIPDANIDLGDPITLLSFDRETGVLTAMRVDGTETTIPLSAFGGTRLANLASPATVLTANGHYLFYSNTGSYYTVICALVLPTAPDDMTYVRISNISSLGSFAVGAGATIAPGGSDKINGVAATFSITDYLVNYRNAVITLTYSAFSENWTVSVLGDLIKPGTVAIYDADKTNTTTLTPVTDLTANRVITLPDANVDLGKVLSNISYAPTTGVITLTNVDSSTFATTNIGAIADDMLRIQATGAATKKMGFNCSAVTAGQTRIVTMPDRDVDLGQLAKGSFTPKELLASSGSQNLEANYSYYLPATYAGALNLVMPASAAIGTTFDIGSIYSNGIDGTFGVNLTALNLTIPAGEYITGWGGAGLGATINLLVSYVTTSGGYTTPNFTQGCTFRLTKTGATSWAIKPTFGSVLPKRFLVKNEGGVGGTIVSTAVPAGTYRELTLPDADVNLGNARILEDLITDQVITPNGFLPAAGVLANTISAGVAYVQGVRVSVPLTNKTWTANKDTYVDLSSTGVYTYVEVANGAGVPAVTPLHMRVAKVVSGATTLGAITMLKAPVTSYGTGSGANIYGANNTLLGKALAPIATTAYGNTIVGNTQCAALSTGYENVVIGAATPVLNTGYHNVVIGKGSGAALTTSQYNVLIGYEAGADNSTILNGIVAIGYSAARHSTGAQITAIGQSAGGANTTGLRWTAIGDSSGSTATASDWTAVGSGAITGAQGVSIGSYAGSGSLGAGNISIGYNAGRTSASDAFSAEAISIGLAASYQSVRGTGSIAIGTRAGSGTVANHKSTSDSYAIYIGWEASRSSTIPTATALDNVIAIGTGAQVAVSNGCVIGSTTTPYKVGINMTTPTARLHLPAGTATAGTAPLKLTSGTNLTTPENGAVEYNGSFYFTQGGVRYSLGDLPNVATGNTLGGTNPRVLAGANNTVSGTNNVVVTGDNNVISGTNQVVLTGSYTADVTWNNAVIQALSYGGASFRQTVAVSTALSGNTFWGSYIFTACTTGGAYGADTVPKTYLSVHTTTAGIQTFRTLAIHTLTIIGRTANGAGSTLNNTYEFVGKRRVVVTWVSGVINLVITTEGTDYNPVGTVALNITNDAGKLKIAPVFTSEAADQTSSAWNILVESMYTTL